jgi:hypothetical protein
MKTNETDYLGVAILSGEHEDAPGEYWAQTPEIDSTDKQYCFCSYYPSEAEAVEDVKERLNEWVTLN